MPFKTYPALSVMTDKQAIREVFNGRTNDVIAIEQLEKGKYQGRYQTGQRAVPTSNSDVTTSDFVGDVLNDATYRYELLDISGTNKWNRTTLDVAW
jgi:hypothetical protein